MKRFISFSGLDGSGKSEQSILLADKLTKVGIRNVVLYSRIGRNRSFFIPRKVLVAVMNAVNAERDSQWKELKQEFITQLYTRLAILDTIFQYALMYRIKSIGFEIVLCDRYIWDSFIDMKILNKNSNIRDLPLWKLLEFVAPKPSLSFVLQISAQQANIREQLRKNDFIEPIDDSIQREQIYKDFILEKVWDVVLNAGNSRKDVQREIINNLIAYFPDVGSFGQDR